MQEVSIVGVMALMRTIAATWSALEKVAILNVGTLCSPSSSAVKSRQLGVARE